MKPPNGPVSPGGMSSDGAQVLPPSLAHSYNYKQNSFNAESPSMSNHKKALRASLNISNMIAKKCKPFIEGEFIKNCMLNAVEIICPEYLDTFKKIKLSNDTISRRINSLALNVNEQLKELCKNFKYYSLCLDDTKDYTGISQLSIFIRGINDNFEITEELLGFVAMGNKTSSTIFYHLNKLLEIYNLDLAKLRGITTDGAPSLLGIKNGLVKKLKVHLFKNTGNSSQLKNFHCILHQEQLIAKSIKSKEIIDLVINILKEFRNKNNLYNEFKIYLKNHHAKYQKLLFYCDTRWLSKGNSFKRFYILLDHLSKFLEKKGIKTNIGDRKWQFNFAFIVDITLILNEINIKLQGKNNFIYKMYNLM